MARRPQHESTFAETLREMRQRKGLRCEGVFSRYERGVLMDPEPATIEHLARVLGCNEDEKCILYTAARQFPPGWVDEIRRRQYWRDIRKVGAVNVAPLPYYEFTAKDENGDTLLLVRPESKPKDGTLMACEVCGEVIVAPCRWNRRTVTVGGVPMPRSRVRLIGRVVGRVHVC